jgi:hypothetical protein
MIDPLSNRLISIRQACRLLPGRGGRPLAISTAYRWIFRGRRGCRLETVVVGGQRYTTEAALREFVASTTAASSPLTHTPRINTPNPQVEQELDRLGL